METYLEAEIPEDLCKHLFLSFMKKSAIAAGAGCGKDFHVKNMAVVASQTICAPLSTELHFEAGTDGSSETGGGGGGGGSGKHHSGLAEKLHGLTEKLHGLGHSRSDSNSGEAGKRSRAGTRAATTDLLDIFISVHPCICPLPFSISSCSWFYILYDVPIFIFKRIKVISSLLVSWYYIYYCLVYQRPVCINIFGHSIKKLNFKYFFCITRGKQN